MNEKFVTMSNTVSHLKRQTAGTLQLYQQTKSDWTRLSVGIRRKELKRAFKSGNTFTAYFFDAKMQIPSGRYLVEDSKLHWITSDLSEQFENPIISYKKLNKYSHFRSKEIKSFSKDTESTAKLMPNESMIKDMDLIFVSSLKEKERLDEMVAMRSLYKHMYDIFDNSQYDRIDKIMLDFISAEFSLQLCVALLTITFPKKDKLNIDLRTKLINYSHDRGIHEGFSELQINQTLAGY